MKTSLKFLALFFAAALPSTFAAELAGADLPAAFDSLHVFSAFVATLVLLTLFSDYSATPRLSRSAATATLAKAEHPLAA